MNPTGLHSCPGSRAFVLAVISLLFVPEPAEAQFLKTNRKWIFAVVGAAAAGIPAVAFSADKESGPACSSKECMGTVAGLIGGAIGYLVGGELDSRYARRVAAGPSIDYDFEDVPLGITPSRMTVFPGGAVVVGVGGARIVRRDGTVVPRGTGVRGIEDVEVMPREDLLVLITFSNLLAFSLADESAKGQVIDELGGNSLGAFSDRLAVAGRDSLRLLSLIRSGDSISVETVTNRENASFVTDMTFSSFAGVGWILMEDRLVAVGPDLGVLGELKLPAPGRSVRAAGDRLVVAAGSDGVFVIDGNPEAPEVVLTYKGLKFAYAADLDGDTLYVAGGPEGAAVVDVSGSEPMTIGIARESRFPVDITVTGAGEVWILDRQGRSIQIANFQPRAVDTTGDSDR